MPQPDDITETIPPADAADRLPRHTTPTWEVELLISGVAVFAMLQLPGLLDDALFALLPRFDPGWSDPAQILYVYIKGVAVILAATFAIHLLLRARWIALVGMHSVHPDGIRWERLRMGPIQREVARRQDPGAAATIEAADNRATTVFSVGVMMATILLAVSLLVACLFALMILAMQATGVRFAFGSLFVLCASLVALPLGIAVIVDRRAGSRLSPDGGGHRVLAALFRIYGRLGVGNGNNVMNLLTSHGSERRSTLMLLLVFVPVMLGITYAMKAAGHPERFGGYAAFPRPGADSGRTIDSAYYDRMRDTARDPAVPYIQDAVIIDPYLKLVVPYRPGDDDAALRRSCPGALAAAGATRDVAVLGCLQQLHAATLDGKPLDTLHYDAGSDPRTDRPALVAMIDVRGLANGRHELRVARTHADPADAGSDGGAMPDMEYVIPFWR
jgi:hypothetical protein